MVIPATSPMLLTRNLLYTGMTRAKELLIVIGNRNVVEFMINNADIKNLWVSIVQSIESVPNRAFYSNLARPVEITDKKVVIAFSKLSLFVT